MRSQKILQNYRAIFGEFRSWIWPILFSKYESNMQISSVGVTDKK